MSNDGGPAFPRPTSPDGDGHTQSETQYGMSLRDYFAAKAPRPGCSELLAVADSAIREQCKKETDRIPWRPTAFDEWWESLSNSGKYSLIAMCNYAYADAMLAERNKTDPEQEAVEVPQ